jgi:diaminohydroxyphosphoribosylaminopyrimidine deaminase/5-amino-6-(5-phosphoribosylamino)uracil reductase
MASSLIEGAKAHLQNAPRGSGKAGPAERDEHFMARALAVAAQGIGTTSPNPPVGAVVVKSGKIVGAGFHRRAGLPHAEVLALRQAGARAHGATLYVSLEPCCHLDKRTPPCVPAILRTGIVRVVVATRDPNPKVRGRGIQALRRDGVKVEVGIGRSEAEALLEPYRTRVTTGRPFVTLKIAATLDGKIATARGESRWITGLAARRVVRKLRESSDGILVGIGTVLADDPSLTSRKDLTRATNPLRIILDPKLRIPLKAKVLTDGKARTLVLTTRSSPKKKRQLLAASGADVLVLPDEAGRFAWKRVLAELGRRGLNTLLIEGGAEVSASVLRGGAVDRLVYFLAPRLLGGNDAVGAIGGSSPARLLDALKLRNITVSQIGADILVTGRLK